MPFTFFNVQNSQFWVSLALICQIIIGAVLFCGVTDEIVPLAEYYAAFSKLADLVVSCFYHVICLSPIQVITIPFRFISKFWNKASPNWYTVNHLPETFWIPLHERMPPVTVRPGRMAIITGGATVVFQELLDEVATPKFLRALSDAGFVNVLIQCGSYKEILRGKLDKLEHEHLVIELEEFVTNMKEVMQDCRGIAGGRPGGVVFSHAGTGTIADCWEAKVANVIVANPNLMDNHQAVFAEEMAKEHETLVLGRLGHLDESIPEVLDVIKAQGLDKLGPSQEPVLPVSDDIRLHFIDNLFKV